MVDDSEDAALSLAKLLRQRGHEVRVAYDGPSALAAMMPSGPGPFVKPVLRIERRALRVWLRKRRLPFRDDPSNASLVFDRNRVRFLVIPRRKSSSMAFIRSIERLKPIARRSSSAWPPVKPAATIAIRISCS